MNSKVKKRGKFNAWTTIRIGVLYPKQEGGIEIEEHHVTFDNDAILLINYALVMSYNAYLINKSICRLELCILK